MNSILDCGGKGCWNFVNLSRCFAVRNCPTTNILLADFAQLLAPVVREREYCSSAVSETFLNPLLATVALSDVGISCDFTDLSKRYFY